MTADEERQVNECVDGLMQALALSADGREDEEEVSLRPFFCEVAEAMGHPEWIEQRLPEGYFWVTAGELRRRVRAARSALAKEST